MVKAVAFGVKVPSFNPCSFLIHFILGGIRWVASKPVDLKLFGVSSLRKIHIRSGNWDDGRLKYVSPKNHVTLPGQLEILGSRHYDSPNQLPMAKDYKDYLQNKRLL